MSWIIKAEDISKMYRLGTVGASSLQDDFKKIWYNIRGKENPFLKIGETNQRDAIGGEYVWALKDINFEVRQGEVLGIIGKNGAGKSTLLKLLSKVTKPTTGSIKTRGRIASLLEVGTGFHPELTGRENIFLNGAILGMKKHEIKAKFDEIVAFSGCERYIDTPVKRYSSGMYVRLAFAVAAHLEPEILIVDEVLAVGDVEFQKKCLGKMKDVSGEGRTVLFVSHNMAAIGQLCQKSILLSQGRMTDFDKTNSVIDNYLSSKNNNSTYLENKEFDSTFIKQVSVLSKDSGKCIDSYKLGEEITLEVQLQLKGNLNFTLGIGLQDQTQQRIMSDYFNLTELCVKASNDCRLIFTIPRDYLAPKEYSFVLALFSSNNNFHQLIDECCHFKVIDNGSSLSSYEGMDMGYLLSKFEVNVQ